MNKYENKNRKIILGIIATIVLGAIGSGVWEKVLSPVSSNIVSALGRFFSSISSSYRNSLYTDIGGGSTRIVGIFSMTFFGIWYLFLATLPVIGSIYLLFRLRRAKLALNSTKEKVEEAKKKTS